MARKQTSLPRKAGRPKTAKEEAIDYVQQVGEDEKNGVTNLVTSNENAETEPTSIPESHVTNLVTSDQEHLEKLEKIIDDGIKAFFYNVGQALGEIRKKQLYKVQSYDRYEDYCLERWNMSRIHAFRLENAAMVIDNLKNRVTSLVTFAPLTESQIRPLTKLDPDQQQQVWEKVIEAAPIVQDKPKVTAKLVEETVSQVTGQQTEEKIEPQKSDKKFNYRLTLDKELNDSLNESFYKIRKFVGQENKSKITKERLAEIMLSVVLQEVALQELGEKRDKSLVISKILEEIENDEN